MIALVDLGIGVMIIAIAFLIYKAAINLNKKDEK
jgi:hypothetical protein